MRQAQEKGRAMRFFGKVLPILLLMIAVFGGFLYWAVQRPYGYEERIHLPLPDQVGGNAPVWVAVLWQLDLLDMSLATDATLRIDVDDFDAILPEKEYSLLVAEVDSPTVTSMLGRITFGSGTGSFEGEGSLIKASARLEGEFYVRERRKYAKDEEQPDTGTQMPFTGKVTAAIESVGLDEQWQLRMDGRTVHFALDEGTRVKWRGQFGEGDHLAELVEGIIGERANSLFEKMEADSSGLRALLTEMIVREGGKDGKKRLRYIRLSRLEVDDCPVLGEDGDLSFSLTGLARVADEPVEFSLPDLVVRDGPCG